MTTCNKGEDCHADNNAAWGASALRFEYLTIAWNIIEGVLCVALGASASILSLVAFGIDSFIEVSASLVLVWRLRSHASPEHAEHAELRARKLVGLSFFALAAYIGVEAALDLWHHSPPETSVAGIVIAALSATVMPLLGKAKHRLAVRLEMSSLASESAQTSLCGYLSIILLASLVIYRITGWWWVDAVSSLAMLPIIVREGMESFRGKPCGCHST